MTVGEEAAGEVEEMAALSMWVSYVRSRGTDLDSRDWRELLT